MASVHRIADVAPSVGRDFVYDVLPALPLRLAVDVGAAAGEHTRRLALLAKDAEVVALEPFPGNHAYLRAATRDLSNVRLIEKAASDRKAGSLRFLVPSVVQGTEAGWEDRAGYSSVGFLPPSQRALDLARLKWLARSLADRARGRARGASSIRVPTTTLDHEFAGRTIDFLKIDVQGAEARVLDGARDLLGSQRVGLLYVEWSDGAAALPDLLAAHGYHLYDSLYVAGPKTLDRAPFEDLGFAGVREIRLSTGNAAFEMALARGSRPPAEAMTEVVRRGLGWIQTDLVAVSPRIHERFLAALQSGAR